MMRRIRFALAATSLLAFPAGAANVPSGYITGVGYARTTSTYRVLVFVSGVRTGSPLGCCDRWEIDGSTAIGQSLLSSILTAYAAHRPIALYGTGYAFGGGDTEAIDYLQVN